MIRILLVDDDPRILQAWQRAFASKPEFHVVGCRTEAGGLDAAIVELKPDQVVIDLTMAGEDPLVSVERLSRTAPEVRCVVHSARSDSETVQKAFDAGAWGFVDKLSAATEMFDVLKKVSQGQVVFPPDGVGMP